MRSHRMKRTDDLLRRIISETLLSKVQDPRIGLVTVTRVDVSREFDTAKVWVSVYGDEEARAATVGDLDDFYMNVLQSIREGFERTDTIPSPMDKVTLCGFRARQVNRKTVLVVDDDTMARQVARDILEYNGITTLAASDGVGALGVMAKHRTAVGVVLLDLILPGINGMAVCRRIMDGYPSTRIILTSGYPIKDRTDLCLTEHEVTFLEKPYRSGELVSTVRDLLDLPEVTLQRQAE